jgi:hypothetical protein
METIKNQEFGGERPLYRRNGLKLDNITIHPGESSVKEYHDILAQNSRFEGKYVFWCGEDLDIRDCYFAETARSSVWHTDRIALTDCLVDAPKMFRECRGVRLRNVRMPLAQETFWDCSDIDIDGLEAANADYMFFHCSNVRIRNFKLHGNYSFQHARNVEIWDSDLQSKDSLWESEHVTVHNSFINGEYLAWHSRNLRLVNCRIGGTQPLCYADGLVLENCTFEPDADLAFEYSDVKATVVNTIPSVKNPRSGFIKAAGYGEIIIDVNIKAPADCIIE